MWYICSMKNKDYDLVLIGAGIMSATLASLVREFDSDKKILIIEKLDAPALESSSVLNNAGTGHAGFCELNYTPIKDGEIDITKAVQINEQFKQSKEFWAHLVNNNHLTTDFIHRVPHISLVTGADDVDFLEKRWNALKQHHMFGDMEFTKDINIIKEWVPLVAEGRDKNTPIAATRMLRGVDVDYGNLTMQLIKYVSSSVDIFYNTHVTDIQKIEDGWEVRIKDIAITTDKVFVGAGGGALILLQKSEIPEIKGYGGFPVSGKWLICDNPSVANRHHAKVYGKASVGAPPMSVPHLDTRIVNGEKILLFGPYAGFSTKFLKYGNRFDLIKSLTLSNIGTMIKAGISNFGLTKYLVKEVARNKNQKFEVLKDYFPNADIKDWKESVAGQRVQVIKEEDGKAIIEFGTEVVASADGSIVGLLGASPGASTAAAIMVKVIEKMYGNQPKLNEVVTSLAKSITDNEEMFKIVEAETSKTLKLI